MRQTIIASALLVFGSAALAQKVTPGLWEHSMSIKSASGQMESAMAEMQKQLAALPADQRKMMEQMMAGQGVGVGPKGQTVRVCVTPAMADRDQMPQADGDCRQTTQRSGNKVSFKFSCTGDPPSSGEGVYTLLSDKAYEGRATMSTIVNGKPEKMNMTHSGKWLGADCGAVKPRP
jgi:hypothetical protein